MAFSGEGLRSDAKHIIIACPSCKFVFWVPSDLWVALCPSCHATIPGDLKRFTATKSEHFKCITTHPLYRDARKKLGLPEPFARGII